MEGGAKGRAATRGRPYGDTGPFIFVGADLRVRPPVRGAHIGAPLQKGFHLIGGVVPRPTIRRGALRAPAAVSVPPHQKSGLWDL